MLATFIISKNGLDVNNFSEKSFVWPILEFKNSWRIGRKRLVEMLLALIKQAIIHEQYLRMYRMIVGGMILFYYVFAVYSYSTLDFFVFDHENLKSRRKMEYSIPLS